MAVFVITITVESDTRNKVDMEAQACAEFIRNGEIIEVLSTRVAKGKSKGSR